VNNPKRFSRIHRLNEEGDREDVQDKVEENRIEKVKNLFGVRIELNSV